MWYYTLNNQQVGPVDEKEIKKLIAAGTITHATMVWMTGMATWQPVGQTALASLMGSVPPPPVGAYPPAMMVVDDPKVATLKSLFMWFWISLIGILVGGIGLIAAAILFFIIVYKAWQLVQHEGIRATPDQAVAYCFVPGWNYYWIFYAFRGLAKEFNELFDRENIAHERFNLNLPTWMIICVFGSPITFGVSLIAFIILWIMFTNKIKNAAIAVIKARK
ncbi:MAG: virion core protein (lumpy skin disease virus)-like protein [Chloroflexi bacterium]|nr:MAG: virion core protein (lumpy skin disease virus)-like protein [Chloroflexota bacterium]MBA4374820.1 hypothetical protein [Anaerolinea sp.]